MCLSARELISGTTHPIVKPNFLCMLPMAVARSSSGTLTIGCIAYRREGSDGSAQHGRSVIYDCLVILFCFILCGRLCWLFVSFWVHVNIFHQVLSYRINMYYVNLWTSAKGPRDADARDEVLTWDNTAQRHSLGGSTLQWVRRYTATHLVLTVTWPPPHIVLCRLLCHLSAHHFYVFKN